MAHNPALPEIPPFIYIKTYKGQFSKVFPDAAQYSKQPEDVAEPNIVLQMPTAMEDGYIHMRLSNTIPICDEQVRLILGDRVLQSTKGSICSRRGELAAISYVQDGTLLYRFVVGFKDIHELVQELFKDEDYGLRPLE